MNMRAGSDSRRRLFQKLSGLFTRRIVGTQIALQITLEQGFGLLQISLLLNVRVRLGEHDPGAVRRYFFSLLKHRVTLLIASVFAQILGQIHYSPNLARGQGDRAPQLFLRGIELLLLICQLRLSEMILRRVQRGDSLGSASAFSKPPPRNPGACR